MSTPPKTYLVSVDVDSLDLYLGLYGHSVRDSTKFVEATYELGVRRFLDLFDELGIQGLFFLVGKDLEVSRAREVAREALERGHLLGNHTWSHDYTFIHKEPAEIRRDISRCQEALRALSPQVVVPVFRAPGYNMTNDTYAALAELGFRYDSSPLPSYPYLLLKYSVMAYLNLARRKTHSIWGNPAGFLGARLPHSRAGITVLPCSTTPGTRLPVIGTALSTVPEPLYHYLHRSIQNDPFIGLEFHAVDLMEQEGDGLHEALRSQKDLLVPLKRKYKRFRTVLEQLAQDRVVYPLSP